MYVVRDTLHCRPGKVKDMVSRFTRAGGVMQRLGFKPMRILTDVSGGRFWTVIAEFEAETIDGFIQMEARVMGDEEMGKIMAGYHDLVESGGREIFAVRS